MEPRTLDKALKPQKDGSTPFGQGQTADTVTQDEQARLSDAHARPPRRGEREPRPTPKR